MNNEHLELPELPEQLPENIQCIVDEIARNIVNREMREARNLASMIPEHLRGHPRVIEIMNQLDS
jgi:hypothetical protein